MDIARSNQSDLSKIFGLTVAVMKDITVLTGHLVKVTAKSAFSVTFGTGKAIVAVG